MHELAPNIFFTNQYTGVTLGALTMPRGIVLVDAPLRVDDSRAWRALLLNRGSGIDRVLINLDAHPDRTIGARSMECTVIAHQKSAQAFRNRPATFKGQGSESGAEWEICSDISTTRWAPPDITFSEHFTLHWGGPDIVLEHHPGPATGAIWLTIPQHKIVFVGDCVTPGQPPFLAQADLTAWIKALELLLSDSFRNYTIVSGRGGPVTCEQIEAQSQWLTELAQKLEQIGGRNATPEMLQSIIPNLLKNFHATTSDRRDLYHARLNYGLQRYFARNYHPVDPEDTEEDAEE